MGLLFRKQKVVSLVTLFELTDPLRTVLVIYPEIMTFGHSALNGIN